MVDLEKSPVELNLSDKLNIIDVEKSLDGLNGLDNENSVDSLN